MLLLTYLKEYDSLEVLKDRMSIALDPFPRLWRLMSIWRSSAGVVNDRNVSMKAFMNLVSEADF